MFLKIKKFIKKDKKIIFFSVLTGIVITIGTGFYTKVYSDTIQKDIADKVIRFHVIANSDLEYDQNLKLKVRDNILNEFKYELNKCQSADETRSFLEKNMNGIIECAQNTIEYYGFNYTVKASIENDMFPTKVYGNVTFPAGEYKALKVIIGNGEGKNWWCVMFPPLCFVDVSKKVIPEENKEQLKNILTEDEYDLIFKSDSEQNLPIKIKFKIVEWWQNHEAEGKK